jgi:acetyl-CoA C-acetyltransferase
MPEVETVPIIDHHDGPATIAAYSVAHGRDGDAEWGLLVVDVPGGRAYARVEDADDLAALEAEEWVGRTVRLTPDGDLNRARLT